MTKAQFPKATILGYPRVGANRELKKSEEAYWSGKISLDELKSAASELRISNYKHIFNLGLKEDWSIPMNFSYYDQVLDTAVAFGIVPERFDGLKKTATSDYSLNGANTREVGSFGERMRRPIGEDELDLDAYFTIARGDTSKGLDGLPGEMTKWFDTNYHYIVPEIGAQTRPNVASWEILRQFEEALEAGLKVRPVLVGPVTLLALAKYENTDYSKFVPSLIAVYARLLGVLASKGCKWVQFDEPALISEAHDFAVADLRKVLKAVYSDLAQLSHESERPNILVTTPFGDFNDAQESLISDYLDLPVEALHFDLCPNQNAQSKDDGSKTMSELSSHKEQLTHKTLVSGLVNGRNIWRSDVSALSAGFKKFKSSLTSDGILTDDNFSVSTSCSLQHVPHSVKFEQKLQSEFPELVTNLSFADEKIAEVVAVSGDTDVPRDAQADLEGRKLVNVANALADVKPSDFERESIEDRKNSQQAKLDLPLLPTTTIGSFPQTVEIRKARAAFKKGEIDVSEYESAMKREIADCVKLQEDLGLDVLVHGEAERNDMVQYFAENFEGFDVTENGWVQSYGSRCTKPSVLWGDVYRKTAFTVPWISYAQSLTDKWMKGMLTGPVTILAWSFVRDDQPKGVTANQVALALRDEITDLEEAGIAVIQVDEPALRELLPLKKSLQPEYLKWSVDSFRLATSSVKVDTQIHTHLCYSEFEVVLPAIIGLNADVTSIEAARSKMEIVSGLVQAKYPLGVGPGVYDIHSPRVPGEQEIEELIQFAVDEFKNGGLPLTDLWINPDCGLKTRKDEESTPSLRNMVAATLSVRSKLS
jgi:5-methyltetrahydropteroyltriglutamate--homocysteine methyltransferase